MLTSMEGETRWSEFGLQLWESAPSVMPGAHQHHEIEINLVIQGSLSYLFGGRLQQLGAGSLSVFWGTLPHRLFAVEPQSRCVVLTLPLPSFLRFGLPGPLAS